MHKNSTEQIDKFEVAFQKYLDAYMLARDLVSVNYHYLNSWLNFVRIQHYNSFGNDYQRYLSQ